MKTCLIVCYGYLGDHIFANSIAEHLIQEGQFDAVDYHIGFPQVRPFFERNPFVRNTIFTTIGPHPRPSGDLSAYDKVFQLGQLHFELAPAIELQLTCGVKNPSSKFSVITNPELDTLVLRTYGQKKLPVVGVMQGWDVKTFLFTRAQYDAAIDVPTFGYGGRHRDTNSIVSELEKHFVTVSIGAPVGVSQFTPNAHEISIDLTASLLKYCDVFVGAEGGMANLAYAVGTNTILTSDFVHQLYGPKGVLRQRENPQLGPYHYESTGHQHIDLDPYLTDTEVAESMAALIPTLLRGNR